VSKLAVLSLKNRALIALITIVAAVFGGLALTSLKQELIPSIEFPQLAILTTYPGASPEVVNNDVSIPIEAAIQAIPGLESTTATSTTNASIIQASFTYGTDLATAEQKITQAINRISAQLPEDIDPLVFSASIDDFPVIQLAITGYDDPAAIQDRLETVIVPEIEDVDGVNAAAIIGGTGQRVTIVPDQAALAAAGYSQSAITDALDANGVLFPGGEITEEGRTLTVQTGAKLTSAEDIAALPLVPETAEQAGTLVTVGDVSAVSQTEDPVQSISRVDGEPALTISVTKLPAANTVDVSRGVLEILPQLEDELDGAQITVVFDQAPYIQQSIDTLAKEGLLGLVFAVLVILVFLLSVRATLVTAISIPTSVLITFIGIQTFGYSLNILTLGALTISIGRVVDDSIVVIENIKRHYVGTADKLQSILLSVREVAGAITASTITTVAVFLPIAFVGDVTGELFRPFALTVTIAMTASLFVALTIVPVLAYWFLRPGKPVVDAEGREIDPEDPTSPPTRLQRAYLPILRWTLKHSVVTVLLAVLVLVGTIALAPLMKTNFLGDSGQNTFTMTQTLEPAASLEVEDEAAAQVEAVLEDIEGIETVQVSIGSSGSALRDAFTGGGAGITYSVTTAAGVDQVALRQEVLDAVADLDDVGTIAIAGGGGGFGGSSDIEIDVTAADREALEAATDEVVSAMEDAEVGAVTSNLSDALPYIAVVVDRDAAAELGLSEVAVGAIVSASMQPRPIGAVEIDDSSLTVYLQSEDPPLTIAELRALPLPSIAGPVPLEEVAAVDETLGPTSVTVQRGLRTATVTITPEGDDLTAASAAVTQALDETELPAGTTASIGGVLSQQQDAFTQLGLALLAAILIVYVVMVATFKSLRQPLLLLVSVPFAATGAILLQIITGIPLGVASLIGVLMLIGIVVTNAIVLIDLVNQYRERGLSVRDAVEAGSVRRFRPIIMTALATIFALTPLAFALTGGGGFISQPLAIVVIGGLVSSTVLTLVVLPTLYNLVEGAKERRAARRAVASGDVDAAPDAAPEPALVGAAAVPETRRERRAREAAAAAVAAGSVATLVAEDDGDSDAPAEVPAEDAAPTEPAEAVAETEPGADAEPEAESDDTAVAEPEAESDDTAVAEPEVDAATEPEVEAEADAEVQAEAQGDDPQPDADPEHSEVEEDGGGEASTDDSHGTTDESDDHRG
jgi:HAE1 family hydrophobic/amphiphilic exporter-1